MESKLKKSADHDNVVVENWWEDDMDDDDDQDDYFEDDVIPSDEDEEMLDEQPIVIKPRVVRQLVVPKQSEVMVVKDIDVKLPLHWCDKTTFVATESTLDPDVFPSMVEDDEGWEKQGKKRQVRKQPDLKKVNEITSRTDPNIRIIFNEQPKYNVFNDRKQNGYGPFNIDLIEHRFNKMCHSLIKQRPCSTTNCRFEHDVVKWCAMDRADKVCNIRQCSLVHHNNPKRPVRMLMCPRGRHCRQQKCFMAHSEDEQFANAQPCKNDKRCTAKRCFRLHTGDTKDTLSARLKL